MPKKSRPEILPEDIPVLPPFPTEAFNVSVTLEVDEIVEVIKVMARGRVAAIRTALYIMSSWPNDKITRIISLRVERA